MAFVDPSSVNTFVPNWDATGMLVALIKDPKKFKINEYVPFRTALKPRGLYVAFESEQAIRVPTREEFRWADGAARPAGNNNLMGHEYRDYATERLDIPFTLGNRTRASCPWDIVGVHAGMALSQYMTLLSWDVMTLLETSGNWGTHTATAASASGVVGGHWDTSTVAESVIQKSLHAAFKAIKRDSNSTVTKDMVRVVIGVDAAQLIRTAPEVLDYLKNSPFAMKQVRGEIAGRNTDFDLPDKLFGYEIVVEDGQRVTTRKAADGSYTRAWIKSADSVVMVSKQDALPGDYVSDAAPVPNYSTFQVFCYVGEDAPDGSKRSFADGASSGESARETGGMPFVVETFEDARNRRLDGHVVGDWGMEMVAAETGYLITDVLA